MPMFPPLQPNSNTNAVAAVVSSASAEFCDDLTILFCAISDVLEYEELSPEGRQSLIAARHAAERASWNTNRLLSFAQKYGAKATRELTADAVYRLGLVGY